MWLKAQVYQHKATEELLHEDERAFEMYDLNFNDHFEAEDTLPIPIETQLECEFLESHGFYLKGFGRLNIDSDDAEYQTKNTAETRWLHRD